jgi:hypothetical protein
MANGRRPTNFVLLEVVTSGRLCAWECLMFPMMHYGLSSFIVNVYFNLFLHSSTLKLLCGEAARKGTNLSHANFVEPIFRCDDLHKAQGSHGLEDVFKQLKSHGVEFAYFFIPGKETHEKRLFIFCIFICLFCAGVIKLFEMQNSIITQCITRDTVYNKMNNNVVGNIIMKTNMKLGGACCCVTVYCYFK